MFESFSTFSHVYLNYTVLGKVLGVKVKALLHYRYLLFLCIVKNQLTTETRSSLASIPSFGAGETPFLNVGLSVLFNLA